MSTTASKTNEILATSPAAMIAAGIVEAILAFEKPKHQRRFLRSLRDVARQMERDANVIRLRGVSPVQSARAKLEAALGIYAGLEIAARRTGDNEIENIALDLDQ